METIHKHFPWITPDEEVWLQDQLMRRAATGFEQAELWPDAAECWADLGEHGRAADLYARAGDLARAANANLDAGRYEDALDGFLAWAEGLSGSDLVGRVECLLGQACCHLLGAAAQNGDDRFSRAAGRDLYRRGRTLIEEAENFSPLQGARAWDALAGYGKRLGRHDLVELAYERALALLGEAGASSEHLRLVEDYHASATAWDDRTLAQSLAERLADLAPLEETPAWMAQRQIIESHAFDDGLRDVLHFTGDVQWQAWAQLAEMDEDELHRGEVDNYLRLLAPEGMVYIPASSFVMGCSDEEIDQALADLNKAGNSNENRRAMLENARGQHSIWLRGFYIDRTPVTNAQFLPFVEEGGYHVEEYWTEAGWSRKENENWTEPRYWTDERYNGAEQPVVGVSWYEALAYARWTGKVLPTEAQWEKAASWDPVTHQRRIYPWGNEWDTARCNANHALVSPVERYSPDGDSAYGIADMAGNRHEWCSTRWGRERWQPEYAYPYQVDDERENLDGDDNILRVLRSGNYSSAEPLGIWQRCGFRFRFIPWFRSNYRGFRCLVPHGFSVFDPGS